MIGERTTTDPADELFDVLNEDGSSANRVKRRAEVHRDGDWHRAFHLWLFAHDPMGDPIVLFQRRASGKDTWPNRLDVAVGGHFRAGETLHDVVREVEEEIGIQPELTDLTYLGRRRALSDGPDWHDRELQDVYALAFPFGFPSFSPNGTELASLAILRINDFVGLFSGETKSTPGIVALVEADRKLGLWKPSQLTRDDWVPVRDHYWLRGVRAGQALLDGDRNVTLE